MLFYHMTESRLEEALPRLLEMSLERGYRVAVQAGNEASRDALDGLLWTYRDDSFLPHGPETCEFAAQHPVLLTACAANPNNADVRFLVDGAEPGDLSGYKRAVFMFDGFSAEAVDAARQNWKRFKGEGHDLSYWQQNRDGRWEKKA
jgi:DNA polymerase-3 subunit chi